MESKMDEKSMSEIEEQMAEIEEIMAEKEAGRAAEELEVARDAGLRKPPKVRAGFTTNKGKGTPKARRKMAAKSRKANRKN